jgi:hypothetical protein
MSFFENISGFVEYLHSIRRLENYLSFDMVFPSKWQIPKSIIEEKKIIPFDSTDQNLRGITFVCEINDLEITTTLAKINKTIRLNLEREQKERLFKQTIDKLKSTFEKNDLEKLQKLYFDFDLETNLEVEDEHGYESEIDELAGEREEKGFDRDREL